MQLFVFILKHNNFTYINSQKYTIVLQTRARITIFFFIKIVFLMSVTFSEKIL